MLARHKKVFKKRPSWRFTPDFIANDICDIDFALLKRNGIRACFLDLDNTVVDYASFEVSTSFRNVLKNCGLDVYIATNRPKGRDLKDLKQTLNATGSVHPHGILGKPFKAYFVNGLKDNLLKRQEVIMIGDRYIQDMFGANRAGVYSLLVHKFGTTRGMVDRLISAVERRVTTLISKRYF